jgi:hypothetical protein
MPSSADAAYLKMIETPVVKVKRDVISEICETDGYPIVYGEK